MVYELYFNKAVKTKKQRIFFAPGPSLGGARGSPSSGGICRIHKAEERLERRSISQPSHTHAQGLQ